MTFGILHPKILLPAHADAWPPDRRRIVLLHELAHIHRHDCLTFLLARLARALFWFHPLVWLASHRLAIECERAADDLVLSAGTRSSTYASTLLHIAATIPPRRSTRPAQPVRHVPHAPPTALAMARPSTLESRLRRILDPAPSRRAMTRATLILALVATAALTIPLACMRAQPAPLKNASIRLTMNLATADYAPPVTLPVTDPNDLATLRAFFPQMDQTESRASAGWISGAVVTFVKTDATTTNVYVSCNDNLTVWSAGHGDYPVTGDLKPFLRTLQRKLAATAASVVTTTAPATPPAPATQPSKLATDRADALKKDLKNFTLNLAYIAGEDNKPFYQLDLSVPPLATRPADSSPYMLAAQITEDQAKKIINHLASDGFLDRAEPPDLYRRDPSWPRGPCYWLRLSNGLGANLGWGLPMLQHLDALRTALDGDAAKKMDLLLGQLATHREEWQKAAATQPTDGGLKIGREHPGGLLLGSYAADNATPGLYPIGAYDRTRLPPFPTLFAWAANGSVAPAPANSSAACPVTAPPPRSCKLSARATNLRFCWPLCRKRPKARTTSGANSRRISPPAGITSF